MAQTPQAQLRAQIASLQASLAVLQALEVANEFNALVQAQIASAVIQIRNKTLTIAMPSGTLPGTLPITLNKG